MVIPMNSTRYTGVNHLALATGDMDMTIRFWRDLLGMRLVGGFGRPGYRHYFFELSDHDMIAFFEWPTVTPLPEKDHGVPVTGPHGFDHLSIGVDADEDLWGIKSRLEAADFWASEVIDHGFIRSVYAFDPNQIPIEFSAVVDGMDLRRHPMLTDTTPSSTALEGPDPRPDQWKASDIGTPPGDRTVYPGEGIDLVNAESKWK